MEEYIAWKKRYSEYTAQTHGEILRTFLKHFKYKSISEMCYLHIQEFFLEIRNKSNGTEYNSVRTMEAIRGFLSYYWTSRQHNLNPKLITNRGVSELQSVEDNDRVITMKREGTKCKMSQSKHSMRNSKQFENMEIESKK